MGRSPCCDDNGLKKGPWTPEEDQKLAMYIHNHGHGTWRTLPQRAGLNRCGKSCRLRWNNYLKPDIKRGMFSDQEEQIILELHSFLGNKWSKIAAHLPGRTDNEIKNHWNTKLKKKLFKIGIDPQTHRPVLPDVSQLLHYPQLLSALNPVANLMNIWTNSLLSHVDTTHLARLQLLQNLLRTALNHADPAGPNHPHFFSSSMLMNGGRGQGDPNLSRVPAMVSDLAPNAVTSSPQNDDMADFGCLNGHYQTENSLPALFEMTTNTSTPETSMTMDQANPSPIQLTDTFENWEELVNQEDFWKEILA